MEQKRIPTTDFSQHNGDLILQIRWLLNEMSTALTELDLGNIEEAKAILKKETDQHTFLLLSDKQTKQKGAY